MKVSIICLILLSIITSCGPVEFISKDIKIEKKEIKGYYIEVFAKRDKYGLNCNAYLSAIRKNSDANTIFIEIQAIDKDQKIISVTNFIIVDADENEKINKNNTFLDIKSCAKIEKLNIFGG